MIWFFLFSFPVREQSIKLIPGHKGLVTEKVFFDITIAGKSKGRIVFGLFGNECPKTGTLALN